MRYLRSSQTLSKDSFLLPLLFFFSDLVKLIHSGPLVCIDDRKGGLNYGVLCIPISPLVIPLSACTLIYFSSRRLRLMYVVIKTQYLRACETALDAFQTPVFPLKHRAEKLELWNESQSRPSWMGFFSDNLKQDVRFVPQSHCRFRL